MIRLECDYGEGAHPKILRRLAETNLDQTPGYGEDAYCERARALIRGLCENEALDVHFLVGGTQTNTAIITAALRPWQGVISAVTGHINVHETGAIEAYGHKVLTLPSADGTISAGDIRRLCESHWGDATHEHMVQPAMVYLSCPTENGTLYSKAALTEIRKVCDAFGLLLYADGARMGYGLMSKANDLTLPDFAALCDAFSIGGTKQGFLFGEALVLTNPVLQRDFRSVIKQQGGLLAKGRLLGLQFTAMLEDGLYFTLARQADEIAMKLRRAFEERGYPMLFDSYTNQQYPILPDETLRRLEKNFAFSYWCRVDETHSAVRVCTCWATTEAAADALIRALDEETADIE